MISVTIDGQTIAVPKGTTVLQAAKMAAIPIPTLCDHPTLKPYGGCRLCVVEVEGIRTLQASCTLPAYKGMVVHTNTPKVCQARALVLELIFSERNHFCMFCQKTGGDCELQNAAYAEEIDHWPMQPGWDPFFVDASHPYFVFDHNRCILCRRCVRACADLVGNHTLGIKNRGSRTMIMADYGLPMGDSSCVRCGTCLQICPTGALIDRHSAYLTKGAPVERIPSVCLGCSLGCGIELVVRDNQLARIEGDWEAQVNEGLLCEMGRFWPVSDQRERLLTPLIRKNGVMEPASWEEALSTLAARLASLRGQNGGGLAALASSRLPAEALYAFAGLFRDQLQGSLVTTIDGEYVYSPQVDGQTAGDLEALKDADCVVLVGVDLLATHPVAGFFVNRNLLDGTRLVVIDPQENQLKDRTAYALTSLSDKVDDLLKALVIALRALNGGVDPSSTVSLPDDPAFNEACEKTGVPTREVAAGAWAIASAQRTIIVTRAGMDLAANGGVLAELARLCGASVLSLPGKANSLAARVYGLDAPVQLKVQQAVYLALGDDELPAHMLEQVEQIPFIAVQASYVSSLTERADIVLPVEMWAEQEGHYLSLDYRLHQARKALAAPSQAWSNLAVLRKLASSLYLSLDELWEEKLFRPVPSDVRKTEPAGT